MMHLNRYKNNRNRIVEQLKSQNYEFDSLAIELFRFQFEFNSTYHNFCKALNVGLTDVKLVQDIPLLPISAFKFHDVTTGEFEPRMTFLSSGTTDQSVRSKHNFLQLELYELGSKLLFERYVHKLEAKTALFSLLPSYIENGDSSLVFMMDHLSKAAGKSGFYLSDFGKLRDDIKEARSRGMLVILIGVSYALLDFGEENDIAHADLIVIETGGMKGRRKEMIKPELHARLSNLYGGVNIMSEYGMTELSSQFYAKRYGQFEEHHFARMLIKDIYDPLKTVEHGKSGQIGVIDLLNVDSCAFIQTHDLGVKSDYSFEILGRLDNSDIRGCSLLYD